VISQGLELSSIVQLPQQWSINVAVTYLDANYKDFTNANCYAHQTEAQGCTSLPGGNVQDLSGHSLPNAPKLSAAASISKHFRLNDYQTAIDLQVRAQDRTNLDPAGSPAAEQAGFAVTNISFSLLAPDKQYTAKVFINNLFDKHYINGITINGNAGGDLMLQLLPQDFSRIIGSSLSFQF
jgi:iron complex outermembrane receptor protein